ncbi:A/G-specific adenine glycosylase [Spirulina sp. 06S082]|uniref:A/G-specific adenine glycosylase n=1 Tax=Spirulina sp. 06S082 TaxID=3110248 RepID=UPI002B212F9E|nr:A/G-specific adenine glycosylase [Spirulina sp. 06S082]MEA5467293.1 A/G-specific adenine glycosylase [Spirulina sp. 06S082]
MSDRRSSLKLTDWETRLSVLAESELRRSLLAWYRQQGRTLPWRGESSDAYKIWISEIMLQQTQVKTVIPYYQRWLKRFPTVEVLAAADGQTVLKAWEGLGYYARGRNLHKAAQQILERYEGKFPDSLEAVLKLPGVGRTTAGGILSAAFNQPISILDGNVKRVLARLSALPIPTAKATNALWSLSDRLLDRANPRDFNQAIMDLGATVCTPKNPTCLLCPWQQQCQAYSQGLQSQLPMKEKAKPLPHKNIGVAVIRNERGHILIDRRLDEGLLGGLWEFPGGKIEENETVEECIKREILEELGIEIEVREHLITLDHAYTHFRITLNVHYCRYLGGEPQAIECQEIRWVTLDEIDQFPFPKANIRIIEALREQNLKSI